MDDLNFVLVGDDKSGLNELSYSSSFLTSCFDASGVGKEMTRSMTLCLVSHETCELLILVMRRSLLSDDLELM